MNNLLPGFVENWPVDEAVRRTIPMARTARFEEVAKTAAFPLSPEAGYITGRNIVVDGGVNRAIQGTWAVRPRSGWGSGCRSGAASERARAVHESGSS